MPPVISARLFCRSRESLIPSMRRLSSCLACAPGCRRGPVARLRCPAAGDGWLQRPGRKRRSASSSHTPPFRPKLAQGALGRHWLDCRDWSFRDTRLDSRAAYSCSDEPQNPSSAYSTPRSQRSRHLNPRSNAPTFGVHPGLALNTKSLLSRAISILGVRRIRDSYPDHGGWPAYTVVVIASARARPDTILEWP